MTPTIVTVIQSVTAINKTYDLSNGKLVKQSHATAKGQAAGVAVAGLPGLARLLRRLCTRTDEVLVFGHFHGNDSIEPFEVLYRKGLARLLGCPTEAVTGGVHTLPDGRRVAARLKDGIDPSPIQLLDFDDAPGIPPGWEGLGIAERLALLDRVIPGISTCERVQWRSSTPRVVAPGGGPGRCGHAAIMVSDPDKMALLGMHLKIEAALAGLDFPSPRYSRKTGEPLPKALRRTLLDPSVWSAERITFCAQPGISDAMRDAGWTVADAAIEIVNADAGPFDLSWLKPPTAERLRLYYEATGEFLSFSGAGRSLCANSRGLLEKSTPIDSRHLPPGDWTFATAVAWMKANGCEQLRCEAPFRQSDSDNAFIRRTTRGRYFVHDNGESTNYWPTEPPWRHINGDKTYWQELEPRHDVRVEQFYSYAQSQQYIFAPSADLWPEKRVRRLLSKMGLFKPDGSPVTVATKDAEGNETEEQVTLSPLVFLDRFRPVQQITWWPGKPEIITDQLIGGGAPVEHRGARVFNQYRPPDFEPGDAAKATPWRDVLYKLWPETANHVEKYLAHRVQHPGVKINHALVLGGPPGIGKDTLLVAVTRTIGPWNLQVIDPPAFVGTFNGWRKSVMLIIGEARDQGYDRYKFYEHCKLMFATPPDMLRVNEKNLREYYVPNVFAPVITTNHLVGGIYLPADDRRHHVNWSTVTWETFATEAEITAITKAEVDGRPAPTPAFWRRFWAWLDAEGFRHVAAYLSSLDLGDFDPKAPPPKTEAFRVIVDAERGMEESALADALDTMQGLNGELPIAVSLDKAIDALESEADRAWFTDRQNYRRLPFIFDRCGYASVRNEAAGDGRWVLGRRRRVVYGRKDKTKREILEFIKQKLRA